MMMYTIGFSGSSSHLTLRDMNVNYAVGFRSANLARKVRSTLSAPPSEPGAGMTLVRGKDVVVCREDFFARSLGLKPAPGARLIIDAGARLVVPKLAFPSRSSLRYGLRPVRAGTFSAYPATLRTGIVVPERVLCESEDELVLSSLVVEPFSTMDGHK
jgi:hypothetical protein